METDIRIMSYNLRGLTILEQWLKTNFFLISIPKAVDIVYGQEHTSFGATTTTSARHLAWGRVHNGPNHG